MGDNVISLNYLNELTHSEVCKLLEACAENIDWWREQESNFRQQYFESDPKNNIIFEDYVSSKAIADSWSTLFDKLNCLLDLFS